MLDPVLEMHVIAKAQQITCAALQKSACIADR